jgi:hypothetical protein
MWKIGGFYMNKLAKLVEFTLEKHIFPKCSQMFFQQKTKKFVKNI